VIGMITPSDQRRGDRTSLFSHRTPHGALEKGSYVIILALTVTQFAYGAGGKGRPRPLHSSSGKPALHRSDSVRLRGGRQGAAAPPAPPAQGCAPWNPNLM